MKGNWRNCSGVKDGMVVESNVNSLSSERHDAVKNGSKVEDVPLRLSVSSLIPAASRIGMSSSKNHDNERCFNFGVHKNGEWRNGCIFQ